MAALALLFAADLTLTLITVLGLDKRLRDVREALREQLEERIPRLRGLHAFQMKRLSQAFPFAGLHPLSRGMAAPARTAAL